MGILESVHIKKRNRMSDEKVDSENIIADIASEYPKLNFQFNIRDLRDVYNPLHNPEHGLEYYHPGTTENPHPDLPTIDIYDKSLKGEKLKKAVAGDMLHFLPYVDQNWTALRQKFADLLTPEQRTIDENAYSMAVKMGETRPYEIWHDQSRLDAYLRGGLFPEVNPEWSKAFTKEQKIILNMMRNYLKGKF